MIDGTCSGLEVVCLATAVELEDDEALVDNDADDVEDDDGLRVETVEVEDEGDTRDDSVDLLDVSTLSFDSLVFLASDDEVVLGVVATCGEGFLSATTEEEDGVDTTGDFG